MIDSHAHYSYFKFDGEFTYLRYSKGEYILEKGDRSSLVKLLKENGVELCIEPAIDMESNYKLLELCRSYPGFFYPCVGVHPTRTFKLGIDSRNELYRIASENSIVAVGETGLDYHYDRNKQHRLRQMYWFVYQINLAHKLNLPLILHTRKGDRDALRILRLFKNKLHGGVVHCFNSDIKTALEYIKLGYHIGIGGALLWKDAEENGLYTVVKEIPADRIVIETDSPYVLPYIEGLSQKKSKKIVNTSLILPEVITKIAELRNTSYEDIERLSSENIKKAVPALTLGGVTEI